MSLDINTPRGQKSLEYAQRCAEIWCSHNPGWQYIVTPENSDSSIDGVLVDPGLTVRAIVEQKSRDMSRVQLAEFKDEWLVTMDKLVRASGVGRQLRVPLVGFLYLIPDECLLTKQLADAEGLFVAKFRVDRTTTQATINGGEAVRANAYIDMAGAKEFTARS